MSDASIPDSALEQLIVIRREQHALAVVGTQRAAAVLPVPDELTDWVVDIRRGRLSVTGGFERWVWMLAKREMAEARDLADAMLTSEQRVVNLLLPKIRTMRSRQAFFDSLNRSA